MASRKSVESRQARLAREARERRHARRTQAKSQNTVEDGEFRPAGENEDPENADQGNNNPENAGQNSLEVSSAQGDRSSENQGDGAGNQPTYAELLAQLQQTQEENQKYRAQQEETDRLVRELIVDREKSKASGKRKMEDRRSHSRDHRSYNEEEENYDRDYHGRGSKEEDHDYGYYGRERKREDDRDCYDKKREREGRYHDYHDRERKVEDRHRDDRYNPDRDYRDRSRRVENRDGRFRVTRQRSPLSRRGYEGMTPAELALEAARGMSRSPFTYRILEFPLPEKGKMKDLPIYEGTTDPVEHLLTFQQKLRVQPDEDEAQCLAFPSSLRGGALIWFRALPEGSIDSFFRLSELFITQYMCFVNQKKNVSDLFALRQLQGEKLRDYVRRFTQLNAQIENCPSETAALAFRAGLLDGSDLQIKLYSDPPRDMTGVLHRAQTAITIEELQLAIKTRTAANVSVAGPIGKSEKNEKRKETGKGKKHEQQSNRTNAPSGKRPRESNTQYTKLNVEASKVWKDNRQLFRNPFPIKIDPEKRDRSKKCEFHNDHGHVTNECYSLKGQIEAMLRKGMLGQYVAGGQRVERNQEQSQAQQANAQGRGNMPVVNMIQGGDRYAYGSKYSRRGALRRMLKDQETGSIDRGQLVNPQVLSIEHANERIWFGKEDFEGIFMPHDDPLVVELEVAGCLVRRCMIDGGSAADVIYMCAFRAMKLDESKILRTKVPLSGFANYEVKPVGSITLEVTAVGVTLPVEFMVVDCPSNYNIMFGRPWIHRMYGIPSTLNQVMRCWTPAGVRDLKGCQLSAKRCFNTSLKKEKEDGDSADEEAKNDVPVAKKKKVEKDQQGSDAVL